MTTQLLTVFERDRYSQFTPDEQAIFDETVKGMKEQFECVLDALLDDLESHIEAIEENYVKKLEADLDDENPIDLIEHDEIKSRYEAAITDFSSLAESLGVILEDADILMTNIREL